MANYYSLDQSFVHQSDTHESSIRWTRIGNASCPVLVFIHGTPWSNVVWHNLAASLSTHYNIYLYDHPGFGVSTPLRRLQGLPEDCQDDLDPSLTHRADATVALFKHWNLQNPPHVVAHDNAGLVSLRLLLQYDIKFASLCLIDVVALGPSGLPFFKLVAENQSVFSAIPPTLLEGFVRAYVRTAAFKGLSKEVEELLCVPWLEGGRQGPEGFLREMVQAHFRDASDVQDAYGSVGGRVPTKIIWGRDDAWLPVGLAQKLGDALKADEVVVVPEAGHLIHYDQPSRLAVEVGFWLAKNSGKSE